MAIIRKCSKCNEIKEMKGKNWCCQFCKNKYERERVKKNPERQKELAKIKYQKNKEKVKKSRDLWRKENPEKERENQRNNYKRKKEQGINLSRYEYERAKKSREKHQQKYPERYKCRIKMNSGIKSGKIKRPKFCNICNETKKIYGHHNDYSKPLEVIWCCSVCHGKFHRKTVGD